MMRGTPADREEALRLAEEVIASGDFSMEEKYADIFAHKHTSPELLFTQYTDRPGGWNDNVQGCSNCSVPVNTEPKRIHRTMICQNITPSWTIRQVNAIPPVWIVSSCPRGKTKPLYGKNFTTCRKKPYPCTTCV